MSLNKIFLSSALTAVLLGLAACDGNEEAIFGVQQTTPEVGQNEEIHYTKIQLSLDGNIVTRGSDAGFVVGTDAERAIKSLLLTYYDAEGNFIESKSFIKEDLVSDKGFFITEHKTKATPSRVLAWANIDNAATLLNGLTKKEAISKIGNTGFLNSKGDFMMTSSSYIQDGQIIYGSTIDKSNTATNVDEIEYVKPVAVYLERMAVKVRINKNDEIKVVLPTLNDELVSFNLTGMALNGTNKSAYYVKNIADYGFTTEQWQIDWNAPTLHRSYWSTDPNYLEEKTNLNAYNYRTYRDITKNTDLTEYCLENTSGNSDFNIQNATHVLVVGQYKLQGIKRGTNLYLYNGKLMTAKDYKSLVRQKHPFFVQTAENKYEKIADNTYIIMRNGVIGNKAANVKIQLKLDKKDTLYKYVGNSYVAITAAEANAELAEEFDGVKYGQGKCYYAVPIQHLGKDGQIGQFGVVRNHFYQITLTTLDSFGSGIWDPGTDPNEDIYPDDDPNDIIPDDNDPGIEDPEIKQPEIDNPENPGGTDPENPGEPIIPEPVDPNSDYFVGLQIKILKWNEITQEIDL